MLLKLLNPTKIAFVLLEFVILGTVGIVTILDVWLNSGIVVGIKGELLWIIICPVDAIL